MQDRGRRSGQNDKAGKRGDEKAQTGAKIADRGEKGGKKKKGGRRFIRSVVVKETVVCYNLCVAWKAWICVESTQEG